MTTMAGGTADAATLPSPFATPEQITERITSELRRVINRSREQYNTRSTHGNKV